MHINVYKKLGFLFLFMIFYKDDVVRLVDIYNNSNKMQGSCD
jgi:hypothetical protein